MVGVLGQCMCRENPFRRLTSSEQSRRVSGVVVLVSVSIESFWPWNSVFGLRSLNQFESLQHLSPAFGYAAFNGRDCCAQEIQSVTSLRSGLRPLRTILSPSDVSQKG